VNDNAMKHIPLHKLFEVAQNPNASFTRDEWEHFRVCDICVDRFGEFVRDLNEIKKRRAATAPEPQSK
jgi:hypothetical protein